MDLQWVSSGLLFWCSGNQFLSVIRFRSSTDVAQGVWQLVGRSSLRPPHHNNFAGQDTTVIKLLICVKTGPDPALCFEVKHVFGWYPLQSAWETNALKCYIQWRVAILTIPFICRGSLAGLRHLHWKLQCSLKYQEVTHISNRRLHLLC